MRPWMGFLGGLRAARNPVAGFGGNIWITQLGAIMTRTCTFKECLSKMSFKGLCKRYVSRMAHALIVGTAPALIVGTAS